MSTADKNSNNRDDILNICANCGKGEESTSNIKKCAACHMVKYCSRECQAAHRLQHKKECKKRASKLHDDALFKQPPLQYGDCQICFLRLPYLMSGRRYQLCCGKLICCGCVYAPVYDHQGNVLAEERCPFCRSLVPNTNEVVVKRNEERVEAGDAESINMMGCYYCSGMYDFPQDYTKALELWHRSAKLGLAASFFQIGCAYNEGWGVEIDRKKARYYYELAAMKGDVDARHNLGCMEASSGNMYKAVKHWMISVEGGMNESLKKIKYLYSKGLATKDDYSKATKDDYSKALQSYQAYLNEIKSDQRDKVAAEDEDCKYY